MRTHVFASGGRKLLQAPYHCTGSDSLLGSVNVAGSICILLLIGFVSGIISSFIFVCFRAKKTLKREEEFRERFGSAIIGTGKGPDVEVLVQSAATPAFRDVPSEKALAEGLRMGPTALPKSTAALAAGPLAMAAGVNSLHASLSNDAIVSTKGKTNDQTYEQQRISEDKIGAAPGANQTPRTSSQTLPQPLAAQSSELIPAYFGPSPNNPLVNASRGGLDASACVIIAESAEFPAGTQRNFSQRTGNPNGSGSNSSNKGDEVHDVQIARVVHSLSTLGPLASSLTLDPGTLLPTPLRSPSMLSDSVKRDSIPRRIVPPASRLQSSPLAVGDSGNPFATSPTSHAAHRQALAELAAAGNDQSSKSDAPDQNISPATIPRLESEQNVVSVGRDLAPRLEAVAPALRMDEEQDDHGNEEISQEVLSRKDAVQDEPLAEEDSNEESHQ